MPGQKPKRQEDLRVDDKLSRMRSPEVDAANRWQAGCEPLPGYRLIEPLGRGGFGEVWKVEVPGGLFKAIKFVNGSSDSTLNTLADQEYKAIQRIKSIRHPYLLSIERIEVSEGALLIVMELADRNLAAVLQDYQARREPGLPRDVLLRYMEEAAEALDLLNFQHQLQHLDVKPHNLFLVANHLKVADFGLVNTLDPSQARRGAQGAVTPLYAAPERFNGGVSRQSDQYSLAIVYQQLLTGTFPFASLHPQQLANLHRTASPNLSPLPMWDQAVLARALAKDPARRYASCLEFVHSLLLNSKLTRTVPVVTRINRMPASPGKNADLAEKSSLLKTADLAERSAPVSGKAYDQVEKTRIVPVEPVKDAEPPPATIRMTVDEISPSPIADVPPVPENPTTRGYLSTTDPSSHDLNLPNFYGHTRQISTPMGDIWLGEDAEGRPRVAYSLLLRPDLHGPVAARLLDLQHPILPPQEATVGPSQQLVLVSEVNLPTLRDQFEFHSKEGNSGISRPILLDWLRRVADGLDSLYSHTGLQHLRLNPSTILADGDLVQLREFGLVSLAWIPTGQPIAPLNARYAAPELAQPGCHPNSDQYSLALIFVEMLTGSPPRAGRAAPPSRPDRPFPGRPGGTGSRSISLPRVNFDLLPATDRPVLARALAENPDQRFGSCTEFFDALEAATPTGQSKSTRLDMPAVVPYTHLLGRTSEPARMVPMLADLVSVLIRGLAGRHTICQAHNIRYSTHPSGIWEFRCPVRVLPGTLPMRLEGFRKLWKASIVETSDESFVMRLGETQEPKPGWFGRSTPSGLELQIQLQSGRNSGVCQAIVRLKTFGGNGLKSSLELIDKAPKLFESVRCFLQANPEQRREIRWPFPQDLRIYPVQPNEGVVAVLTGKGKDISKGGFPSSYRNYRQQITFTFTSPKTPKCATWPCRPESFARPPSVAAGSNSERNSLRNDGDPLRRSSHISQRRSDRPYTRRRQ